MLSLTSSAALAATNANARKAKSKTTLARIVSSKQLCKENNTQFSKLRKI